MLNRLLSLIGLLLIAPIVQAQVTTIPVVPTLDQPVTILFDATQGSGGLANYDGKVYIHTGVITDASTHPSDWRCVVTNWGQDIEAINLMTRDEENPNLYRLVIEDIRAYYNKGSNCLGNSQILKLAMVFRNAGPNPSREGKGPGNSDIFVDVAQESNYVRFTSPTASNLFAEIGQNVNITAVGQSTNSSVNSISILINGNEAASTTTSDTLNFVYVPEGSGVVTFVAIAEFEDDQVKTDSLRLVVNPPRANVPVPAGMLDGINYNPSNPSEITLVLFAPRKDFVYVIGDMNDWQADPGYFMNRHEITPDSVRFWITLDIFEPGIEYTFQYYIDGQIRIADPYSEKILDPFDDHFIPESVYPNLQPFPHGKTEFHVSVLQPGKEKYQWRVTNFQPPPKEKLVIYELLIRDFIGTRSFETLIDTLDYLQRLGVNAIELMPVSEFEGNLSWGYNASFHMALDKFYGTEEAFKRFIDAAHERGIAVIMDIVLNHAFGQNPLVRMYASGSFGPVTADNPWFNVTARHDFNVGFDFNHASTATRYYTRRVIEHWMKEYNIDGYRFDLSKGFTQKNTLGNVAEWGRRDPQRIALWKELADFMWEINPNFYVILEHFADNNEEVELANYGMMLWGNLNYNFSEGTMGYAGNSNFGSLSYKQRGWAQPNLIGYMESHDEERVMFRNLTYGANQTGHNVRDPFIALERTKMAAAFFFATPGPKMIWQFGELGYAESINRCANGSISEGCRLVEKPLPWGNIYLNPQNQRLFDVYSEMIRLKTTEPAFSTDDFSQTVSDAMKRLILRHEDMDVVLIGNFGMTTASIVPTFTKTGLWYDFFRGTQYEVTDSNAPIELLAGEFRLYTTKFIPVSKSGLVSTDLDSNQPDLPQVMALHPNYPNPFNPSTTLSFDLPSPAKIRLEIFDVLGRRVAVLIDGQDFSAGSHRFSLDAGRWASGTYLVRLSSGDAKLHQKIQFIK